MIVSKFGGSSVKDAEAMRRCASIVKANSNIKVVILSATYNTTNNLEEMAKLASTCLDYSELLELVRKRHLEIFKDLSLRPETLLPIDDLLYELRGILARIGAEKRVTPKYLDKIYSIGERLSTNLFFEYLRANIPDRRVIISDARKIIRTNSDFNSATPDQNKITKCCEINWAQFINGSDLIITQGFIGSDDAGNTTTLGREGSDYSAALIANAIDATAVHIWTDVDGIYDKDPRKFSDAIKIPQMSYELASDMAENGAKVLFPKTLSPAKEKGIEVIVASTLCPEIDGTVIK